MTAKAVNGHFYVSVTNTAGHSHRTSDPHLRTVPSSRQLKHQGQGSTGLGLAIAKQIAPSVTRAAVLREPAMTSGIGQFAVIQSVAPSIGIEVSPINLRDVQEIERAVATFTARVASGGLVVTASPLSLFHR